MVWRGGSIADALPSAELGSFDAFIASHVIEHTTDIVSFLDAAQRLLKPEGVVILAVPDKRKCFDFNRPVSTTAGAIAAFREKRTLHTPESYFDFMAFHTCKSGPPGWAGDDATPQTLQIPFDRLLPAWDMMATATSYTDNHQWVFTPASFELMVLELAELGFLQLRVEAIQQAVATEFYAWLRPGREAHSPRGTSAQATPAHGRVVIDLAEQSRQIADSPLNQAVARIAALEAAEQSVARKTAQLAELSALKKAIPRWMRQRIVAWYARRAARSPGR